MNYSHIVEGKFISRPNRFIAMVEVGGKVETVHVKNTGRCKELLIEGSKVFLQKAENPMRKTQFDLISVMKDDTLINMDSQVPNKVVFEWLQNDNFFQDITLIKPEKTYGKSRFDFYVETASEKAFVEVKGVTLEVDGVAMFPDAPTERGVKHVNELIECIKDGYCAYLFFVIQMKGTHLFMPNWETHQAFGKALKKGEKAGVSIRAMDCRVTPDSIQIDSPIDILL